MSAPAAPEVGFGVPCSRRSFLRRTAAGTGAATWAGLGLGCGDGPGDAGNGSARSGATSGDPASGDPASGDADSALTAMTVGGPVPAAELGATLPHEHVLVDFGGADVVGPHRYDRQAVIEAALPHLEALRAAGGETLGACTPAYLGRDVGILRELARRTGLRILTNTGYYGANEDRHLPAHAFEESADALADRWIREGEAGIEDTGVRPGFVKIGVDPGPLSAVDEKLVRAACRTHRTTGLTIAAHTGPAVPAFEQLAILREERVDPSAWIWVHAQNESDRSRHVEAARRGAWVEFDGYEPAQTERYVIVLRRMKEAGVLERVLISQDNGWYHVGEPGGGTYQPYDPLFTNLLPALREAGFTGEEIRTLTERNPAEAFAVRVRAREESAPNPSSA